MRRILLGSILFSWISVLAGVVMHGVGVTDHGLLYELQLALIDLPGFSPSSPTARAVLTGIIVVTLTAMLWALMIAVATEEEERRERAVSIGAAFAWVLLVTGACMILAVVADTPQVLLMLFTIQMTTLMTMLAAGGLEVAWDTRNAERPPVLDERETGGHFARHMAVLSARLATIGTPANDREPR